MPELIRGSSVGVFREYVTGVLDKMEEVEIRAVIKYLSKKGMSYSLAVMVMNKGYDIARALKIT
jgi:hypothetical protein